MEKKYKTLIYKNIKSEMNEVPFHGSVEGLTRLSNAQFPIHAAIHEIRKVGGEYKQYTQLHTHDVNEVNIIIGVGGLLVYSIQLGDEVYEVESCSSIFIPAGLAHAANIISGSGYYIAIRLDATNQANVLADSPDMKRLITK